MYLILVRVRTRVHLLAVPTVLLMLWLEGLVPACLLLLAAGVHECGHLAALRMLLIPVRRVDVLPMGAVIEYDDSLCSHKQTACVASAGAGANLLASLIFLPWTQNLYVLFFVLANVSLATMNMLPIETLDGGVVLRSLLLMSAAPDAALRICRIVSRVCLACLGLCLLLLGMHAAFPLWYLLLSLVMLSQIFR